MADSDDMSGTRGGPGDAAATGAAPSAPAAVRFAACPDPRGARFGLHERV